MSDWQDGYTDGRYYIEHPQGVDPACKGMVRPNNADYVLGFQAGAEDATSERKLK